MIWRSFYTLVYSQHRDAAIIPIPIASEWVRIEIIVLTFPRPNWYRAGWLNQVIVTDGKPSIMPSQVVPLQPSIFRFEAELIYQLRFKPVPYLPNSLVRFYRSVG